MLAPDQSNNGTPMLNLGFQYWVGKTKTYLRDVAERRLAGTRARTDAVFSIARPNKIAARAEYAPRKRRMNETLNKSI